MSAGTASRPSGRLLLGQPIEDYALRRSAVRAAAPGDLFLFLGGSGGDDLERYRFRADNNLVYLTGVEAPGMALALLPGGDAADPREILFVPGGAAAVRWQDATLAPGVAAEQATGVARVRDRGAMWDVIAPFVRRAGQVHVQVGSRPTDGSVAQRLREISSSVVVRDDAATYVSALRRVKSAAEVARIRAAISATSAGEAAAAQAIRRGVTELAVEGAILAAFRRAGAPREAFPCVVASGPNSTILHHFSGPRQMLAGDVVVVDIGAEVDYYAADLTRTWPVSGRFTPRQRQVYRLVLETQRACAEAVTPGVTTLRDLNRVAVDHLRRSPLRGVDDAGEEATMDRFFLHSIGHPLGMDVHDAGSPDEPLRPGMVFTIEPGVYLRREGVGVRIEDDYLVAATGVEKLSRGVPSDLAHAEGRRLPGR